MGTSTFNSYVSAFDSYVDARNAALKCFREGSKNPDMKGLEYRVYHYWGKFHLWKGLCSRDFPVVQVGEVFSIKV